MPFSLSDKAGPGISTMVDKGAGGFRRALMQAGWFDAGWYLQRHPHVSAAGWHPADHYLAIGLPSGYDPGPWGMPAGLSAPDRQQADPGQAVAGLLQTPVPAAAIAHRADPQAVIHALRQRLLAMGFTDPALADLNALVTDAGEQPAVRALAARELALWHMRARDAAGYRAALDWIARARSLAGLQRSALPGSGVAPPFLTRLRLTEMLCLHHLGRDTEARAAYDHAALAGEVDDDLMLARATLAADPGERLAWINAVLARGGLPPLSLLPADGTLPYDRLTMARPPACVSGDPLVTVLVAAHQAGATLPTALRALQEQSWQNLEILVLDDASPGPETAQVAQAFAARDPRIRLIRMDRNGGAYVARNHGLAQAKGEFVTLHDADDWAHPLRIETQMRHLRDNPGVIGCLSLQARMRDDLRLTRWTGDGHFIIPNTASFLFRRAPVVQDFGGWDRVRISADNELIRRIRRVHGPGAVVQLQGAPLAFQRDSDTSVVADEHLGINGFLYGARRAYAEAQTHHRDTGGGLDYATTQRPFPVQVQVQVLGGAGAAAARLNKIGGHILHRDGKCLAPKACPVRTARLRRDAMMANDANIAEDTLFEPERHRARRRTGRCASGATIGTKAAAWAPHVHASDCPLDSLPLRGPALTHQGAQPPCCRSDAAYMAPADITPASTETPLPRGSHPYLVARRKADARVGQKGTLTRLWARKGTHPGAPKGCRYAPAFARSRARSSQAESRIPKLGLI